MGSVRIAVVTDIHAGVERSNIRSGQAIELLERVVEEASRHQVDLLVTLGDNVNATDPAHDAAWLRTVRRVLDRCEAAVVPLLGNNEYKFLDRHEAADALSCEPGSEVREVNGWSLIFWRPSCCLPLDGGLRLSEADLSSLADCLAEARYPAVLFMHAPIDSHSMVGNLYFENRPELACYVNAAQARALIGRHGNVVLALSGHVHWNAGATIDGVHYRSIASLADTFIGAEDAPPSASWALLDLAENGWLSVNVRGREPMSWGAFAKQQGARWRDPLPGAAFDARMVALWNGGVTQ